ncbi:dynein regulatory complex subunit 7-like isoform X2 [Symsagittifera roscoffensis]|uniref:dynein regulatory complex subunit 7-like isoform X2 n=1 Tax=Symsagittifera roscoffensis TaxID=84072 RepID=UPI00307BE563
MVDPSNQTAEDTLQEKSQEANGEEAELDENGESAVIEPNEPPKRVLVAESKKPFKPPDGLRVKDLPLSYRSNSQKEELIIEYAENFRRQYVHLYRDRKPLLLSPLNEAGVQKFVCLTVRPTLLPYKVLWDYDQAAVFVSDYLSFEKLPNPTEIPENLFSPTTVLSLQRGNCFDFSVLLCSLLLGSGYDAYVVCGYATKETTLMDQTRELCPLLNKSEQAKKEEREAEKKKYSVKPPKDLSSKYVRMMEERRVKKEQEEVARRKAEDEARIAELEKPPPDELDGLRVHCWVLVLHGKREVPENFFIEALTGQTYPTTHPNYQGIESLWNHKNHWVCMQMGANGCKDMSFDLGDCTKWEFMFPQTEQPQLLVPEQEGLEDLGEDDEEMLDEREIDLPPSYVNPIEISQKDFEKRCPKGMKTILYKKAKVEKYAEYLERGGMKPDGLVQKLFVYEDNEWAHCVSVKEWYKHRKDLLFERESDKTTGHVTEHFYPGRPSAIKDHSYLSMSPYSPETDRTMLFYENVRVDGLLKRVEKTLQLTEEYQKRPDRLYYRNVTFGRRAKTFAPSETKNSRPIEIIVEKYSRDPSVKADEDIAELIFHIGEERILVTYHRDENRIAPSYREFTKSGQTDDKTSEPILGPEHVTSFQVDHTAPQPKHLVLYETYLTLLKREEASIKTIRDIEEEIEQFLNLRAKEEGSPVLEVSHYDTEKNDEIKRQRRLLEKQEMEEKQRREEMELDYLAPFFAQIGSSSEGEKGGGTLTEPQARKMKEDALADLKQRLIDKANLIQARFEKETGLLEKKQQWYQEQQLLMTKAEEEEYLAYCSDAMFRIHILEQRLAAHKASAPQKYKKLEEKLMSDPRLAKYIAR